MNPAHRDFPADRRADRTKFLSVGCGLLVTQFFTVALSGHAADHNVTVNGSSFSPATLTIETGDAVIWENAEDFPHTTTSDLSFFDPNYWDGPLASQGDTFSFTFNSAGTFTYHDQTSSGTGTITVILPTSLAIVLEAPRIEGSQFLFDATGLTVGKTNVLLTSTNLTSWVATITNVAVATSWTFTNATVLPRRYFRLLEQP